MSLSRSIGLAFLLVVLVLSGAAFASGEDPQPPAPSSGAAPDRSVEAEGSATHLVKVYYFRTTKRCVSCKKIEAYTDEAIRSAFARELKDGKMTWEVVNIQEPGNEHFIQDYKLFAKSVVVVDVVRGARVRWKYLERIWELLDDRPAFVRYVQDGVRQYLEGRS